MYSYITINYSEIVFGIETMETDRDGSPNGSHPHTMYIISLHSKFGILILFHSDSC